MAVNHILVKFTKQKICDTRSRRTSRGLERACGALCKPRAPKRAEGACMSRVPRMKRHNPQKNPQVALWVSFIQIALKGYSEEKPAGFTNSPVTVATCLVDPINTVFASVPTVQVSPARKNTVKSTFSVVAAPVAPPAKANP